MSFDNHLHITFLPMNLHLLNKEIIQSLKPTKSEFNVN